MQNYTKDAIFQKNLLFFLPYYIMRYEKSLNEISQDSDKLTALLKDYEDIRIRLEEELFKDNKSVLYTDLINLIKKISDYILREETIIRKGVEDAMGGKVLELESERLFRIGKAEGKAEGEWDVLTSLVKKGNLTIETAAEQIGISVDEFQQKMLNM